MNVSKALNFKIVHLSSVDSTNIHARQWIDENTFEEGLVFVTKFQSDGKGQKDSKWLSDSGLNLLFTIVIKPQIDINNRFHLSQLASLTIVNVLDKLSVEGVSIKWPNDILVDNKKIAGILIENGIKGKTISNSMIGIGLNVNQYDFIDFERQATSLKIELGKEYKQNLILDSILVEFKKLYFLLKTNPKKINDLYQSKLYGRGQKLLFESEGLLFKGIIKRVSPQGYLQMEKEEKTVEFGIKEIKFKA